MNRSDLRLLFGAVLAVVVPALVLDSMVDEVRRTAGLSAAPFAWRRQLVAHLIAALPLGLIVAARCRPALPALAWGWWVALAAGVAVLAGAGGGSIGDAVARTELGMVPLLLLRSLFAFVLVGPWCLTAVDPAPRTRPSVPLPLAIAIGVGLALLPCGLYAEAIITAQTKEAATLLRQKRTARAEGIVIGLRELGSGQTINGTSPSKLAEVLAFRLSALRREMDRPPRESPSRGDRMTQVPLLIELDRLQEAAALLDPLVPGDDAATMMLAAVYRNLQRWAESDALYSVVLEKLLPRARADGSARLSCRTAFEGLAGNAQMDARPADAEAALTRGLNELPEDASYFHFLLGRHFHDLGRFGIALEHLEAATRLDPTGVGKTADAYVRRIRTATPGCLWRGPAR